MPEDLLLQVSELCHTFKKRRVLNSVSFDVRRGEVFGLLGPNGSGKSTTLSIIIGLLRLQSGSVIFDGETLKDSDRNFRKNTGMVFQTPSLDQKLSARENLHLAASLYGMSGSMARDKVGEYLEKAKLSTRADEPVSKLSGGMKRRLDIARALLHQPKLLLMDEPTVGLDETVFRETWDELHSIGRDHDLTILLCTHRPDEAERCDRLAIFSNGRIDTIDSPINFKKRLSNDLIILRGNDLGPFKDTLEKRFSATCSVKDGELLVECENGHELIPRIVELYPKARLKSVILRQPNLADLFLKITGNRLEDESY